MLSNTHRWLQLPLSRSWYAVPSPRRPPIRLDWELLIPGVLAAIACSFRACTPNPTLGLRESRFRDPGDGSFDVLLIQDRASFVDYFSPSTRYRSAGRPDPVAHSWLQPRDPPAAALAESTLPKLDKISVVEIWRRPPYAFHLLHSHENGGSHSRTRNTSCGIQLSALAITDCRNDVVPILSV